MILFYSSKSLLKFFYKCQHFPDGAVHAHEHRPGDDTVSDAEFIDFVKTLKRLYGIVTNTMSGVNAHSQFKSELCGINDIGKSLVSFFGSLCITEYAGMYLHHVRIDLMGNFDLIRVGIDEDAHGNTVVLKRADGFSNGIFVHD